jgi:Cdc6-like AAA superfamily ATPase
MLLRPRMVGRAAELSELESELRGARAGDPRSILVLAEPGMGKTRLATELLSRYRRSSCSSSSRGRPRSSCARGSSAITACWYWPASSVAVSGKKRE